MHVLPIRRRDTTGPLRLRPWDGRPRCLLEQLTQTIWSHPIRYHIAFFFVLSTALQLGAR